MKKFRRIGVLTSGGDAPGMNAAVRAVVRAGLANGIEVYGIKEGYKGLVEDNMQLFGSACDVSNIITLSGTAIYTERCDEFATDEGMRKALEVCRKNNIDGVVAIGGDGTFRGATDLASHGIPTIGIPATIDNDVTASDYTIGFDTAMTTVLDFVDSLRATSESHARACVVEVMGRHAGHIALRTAVACGAFAVAVPEFDFDEDAVIKSIIEKRKEGKRGFVVIVSEGLPGYAEKLAKTIGEKTGIATRYANPGHAQRGGAPTLTDRLIASEMGALAVRQLLAGNSDIVVCQRDGKLTTCEIKRALNVDRMFKGKMTDAERAALTPEDKAFMEARCDELRTSMKALYDLTYAIK
ncbi:MAG: 6-phosphofructokinase [Clostridiales bacterium]|nr:6-phosphofructokinase [Clostridiales bacterium]